MRGRHGPPKAGIVFVEGGTGGLNPDWIEGFGDEVEVELLLEG